MGVPPVIQFSRDFPWNQPAGHWGSPETSIPGCQVWQVRIPWVTTWRVIILRGPRYASPRRASMRCAAMKICVGIPSKRRSWTGQRPAATRFLMIFAMAASPNTQKSPKRRPQPSNGNFRGGKVNNMFGYHISGKNGWLTNISQHKWNFLSTSLWLTCCPDLPSVPNAFRRYMRNPWCRESLALRFPWCHQCLAISIQRSFVSARALAFAPVHGLEDFPDGWLYI